MGNKSESDSTEIRDRESLLVKIAAALGGQVGVFVFGFITAIIVARALGPEGKGSFSLVILIANLIYNFCHGSLGSANSHFAGRFNRHISGIIGNSLFIVFFWGGLIAAVFIAFAEAAVGYFYPDVDLSLVKATAIAIPALILFEYSSGIVRGQDRIRQYSLLLVVKELSFLIALVFLLIIGKVSVGGVVYCWIFGVVISALVSAISACAGNKFNLSLDRQILKPMAKYSLQSHAANLASFLKTRIDWLLIPYFLDEISLGYYANSSAIILVLWFLPAAMAQILQPHIAWRENTSGDKLTPVLCRITTFLTCIAGLLMIVFGKIGVRIVFGAEFLPSYMPLVILIPGAILLGVSKLIAGDLGGRGLPHYAMKISIAVLFINIAANLLLIPTLGIAGAAIAATFSFSCNGLLFLFAFRKESGVGIFDTLIMKKTDVDLIARSAAEWRKR